MKNRSTDRHFLRPLLYFSLACFSGLLAADERPLLIHAARVFDGYVMHSDAAILIAGDKIADIDRTAAFDDIDANRIELGDATLLPGFIELHAHLTFRHVPADAVLRHGITTLRDVGGPLHQPYGGDGKLRLMTSGPILTAPGGYPIPSLGETDIAIAVEDEAQARAAVGKLVAGGAVVIKVALEPGGEAGAPWAGGHAHGHGHHNDGGSSPWPLLPENVVKAIVDEAHRLSRKVSAHLSEAQGVRIALATGIDEWAHTPCEALPEDLLNQAAAQHVKIISTIDTLSKCPGVFDNVKRLAALGAEFLYGAEIAHPDIPWGIDAQELLYLQHLTGMKALELLRMATSQAGQYLDMPLLGTLLPGAVADLIAVKGDPLLNLKLLEYPDLVISGGKLVVDRFSAVSHSSD